MQSWKGSRLTFLVIRSEVAKYLWLFYLLTRGYRLVGQEASNEGTPPLQVCSFLSIKYLPSQSNGWVASNSDRGTNYRMLWIHLHCTLASLPDFPRSQYRNPSKLKIGSSSHVISPRIVYAAFCQQAYIGPALYNLVSRAYDAQAECAGTSSRLNRVCAIGT